MKSLATTALALCLMILIGCAEGNAPDPAATATISQATNKVEANVEGMDCTGCSGSIVAAVEKIEGVTAAQADVKTGDVTVALTDDADALATKAEIETVIASLSDGKYKVKSIEVSIAPKAESEPAETPASEEPASEEPAVDDQASGEPAEEVFVFTSYKVTGMDCSGCSSQIVKAVEQVDGVKKVQADHMTGAVQVSFEDRFDDKKKTDEIKDVIAGLSNGKYTVSY